METAAKETKQFIGTIRPLREEDILALRQISEYWLRDLGRVAYEEVEGDMATLRESLDDGSTKHMFVAQTQDGEVVGMMGISEKPKDPLIPFAQTENPCELIVAYVHPEFRGGQGVGTALINASQDLARNLGKKEILLESGPRNIRSGYPFYDKQPGFKRVGQIKNFYGKGVHTIVWQKTFKASDTPQ